MATVIEIVKNYLEENGYDGLCNQECGCLTGDLVPCDSDFSFCVPGYKVIRPLIYDDRRNWYVCDDKNAKPWEDED